LVGLLLFLLSTTLLVTVTEAKKSLDSHELKQVFPDHPVMLDARYKEKSGVLLSQSWDIAQVEFDVQEPLYQHVVVPCFNCSAKYPKDNCACDYSHPDSCGKVPAGCPKGRSVTISTSENSFIARTHIFKNYSESCPANLTKLYCKNNDVPDWRYLGESNDFTLKNQEMTRGEVSTSYY